MSKKGYGNVNPRFAKYFARHKNSSGPHDPKNAKQQALEKLADQEAEVPPEEIFDVNEYVRVIAGEHEGEYGRIVIRRHSYYTGVSYGLLFAWDVSMVPYYVSGNQIERDNGTE